MKVLVLLTVITAYCGGASWWRGQTKEGGKAEFCGSYDCPEFTVLEHHEHYELRRYNSTVWVTAEAPTMEGEYWDDRWYEKETFMKLFRYIGGENHQNMTIDMTVPVLKSHTNSSVHMSFMLPPHLAHNPPRPLDSNLTIFRQNGGDVFVRSFGGWPYGFFGWSNYFKLELQFLYWNLRDAGESFDNSTVFYTATYNDPWTFFHRHNEVWLLKA